MNHRRAFVIKLGEWIMKKILFGLLITASFSAFSSVRDCSNIDSNSKYVYCLGTKYGFEDNCNLAGRDSIYKVCMGVKYSLKEVCNDVNDWPISNRCWAAFYAKRNDCSKISGRPTASRQCYKIRSAMDYLGL